MKFMRALTLIYLIDLLIVVSVTLAQNWNLFQTYGAQQKRQQSCRFPLFNCRLINKLRTTKRQTGIKNQMNGAYDQSLSYPTYTHPYSGSPNAVNYFPNSPEYQSASNEYPVTADNSLHNSQQTAFGPQSTYTAQNYGQSPNTIDVHQVLDQFIRSAGLSPQGDHEADAAHSSSFAKAGTSPVLVFKKLLSFPFYLSTDPNVVDIYGKKWK